MADILSFNKKIMLFVFIILIIYLLSLKIKPIDKNININNKLILYYNSSDLNSLNFIDTIWKQLILKYKKNTNLIFIELNLDKSKLLNNISPIPKLYYIDYNKNIILEYLDELSFKKIEKWMINYMF
jgi:hypothetical protein